MKLELIMVSFVSDLDLMVCKKLLRFFLFLRGSFFGWKSILFLNIQLLLFDEKKKKFFVLLKLKNYILKKVLLLYVVCVKRDESSVC